MCIATTIRYLWLIIIIKLITHLLIYKTCDIHVTLYIQYVYHPCTQCMIYLSSQTICLVFSIYISLNHESSVSNLNIYFSIFTNDFIYIVLLLLFIFSLQMIASLKWYTFLLYHYKRYIYIDSLAICIANTIKSLSLDLYLCLTLTLTLSLY